MSEKDWWSMYGHFNRWRFCPTRPDPSEVLIFYLKKRGIPPEEHVSFLIKLLDLQKSMVYNILNGEGFDAISRCRHLVETLKIHPPLLGVDAKYYPIEQHRYWWRDFGFDFHADAQGYPLMSDVIAYFRTQRTQVIEGGKVKIWSQEDLGDATGLKKETIYRTEHDKNPLILESMERRCIIASALGTRSKDMEPMLFRLFGLDPQAYGVQVAAQDVIPEVHFLPERLTDEILREYQEKLAAFFPEYETGHAYTVLEEAYESLRRFSLLQSKAETGEQRVRLVALLCGYHRLLSRITREQCRPKIAQFHANKAITLAEQAIRFHHPTLDHPAVLVLLREVFAAALIVQAEVSYELENYEAAQSTLDRALSLSPVLQSCQLKFNLATVAGCITAQTAQNETDRSVVLSYFSQAAHINDSIRTSSRDEHFMYGGTGLLNLRTAMALSAPGMQGTTGNTVCELLECAQRLIPAEFLRQHTLIEVLQAKSAFAAGDAELATEVALSALEKSQACRSRFLRDRIEQLYQQLLETSFRDRPIVAYLGVQLRMWAHGID